MRNLKLAVVMIIGMFMYSCHDQEQLLSKTEKNTVKIDVSKLSSFKGLPVNHRFTCKP